MHIDEKIPMKKNMRFPRIQRIYKTVQCQFTSSLTSSLKARGFPVST